MSVSAAQADAFYRELVFTVFDAGGYPLPIGSSGSERWRSGPSGRERSASIDNVPAYSAVEVEEIERGRWRKKWLPGLGRDGLLVGSNWSGKRATGYDLSPDDVLRNLQASVR